MFVEESFLEENQRPRHLIC